jgi:hypothetical protein
MFQHMRAPLNLAPVETQEFTSGVILLKYRIQCGSHDQLFALFRDIIVDGSYIRPMKEPAVSQGAAEVSGSWVGANTCDREE